MADGFVVQANGVATGTSKKTLLKIKAPTNSPAKITQIVFGFDGTSGSATPIDIFLQHVSDDGTLSAMTAGTDFHWVDFARAETLPLTCKKAASVEPTTCTTIAATHIHPQSGMIWTLPFPIVIPGGNCLGIASNAGSSVNCNISVFGEV